MTKTKKLTREQLEETLSQEWRNIHHNASISSHYPETKNEYENDLFWRWLGDHTSDMIEFLREDIKEQYGEELKFYSCGRMGATIYPDKYMQSVGGSGFGPLRFSMDEGLSGYNDGLRVLDILKTINNFWHDTVKDLPEAWKQAKKDNDWQADIDNHDGMESYQATLWRKKK